MVRGRREGVGVGCLQMSTHGLPHGWREQSLRAEAQRGQGTARATGAPALPAWQLLDANMGLASACRAVRLGFTTHPVRQS